MEVILKEDVNKLGHRGDVVKVAEGYGRNYLIPHKLAIEATAKEKGSAEALGQQLSGQALEFTRKSGEHDQLFGSVTSADIAHALEAKGFTIDRRKIDLDVPLKTVGEFNVPIKLHKDVTVTVKVTVGKEAGSEVAPVAVEETASAEA
jgi:large subunit ribosomal protein L9